MRQKTLVLIKPDAMEQNLTQSIIAEIEGVLSLRIDDRRVVWMKPPLVAEHYAHHCDKPYFPAISAYMTRGPCFALIVSGEDAVARVRWLAGATDPTKAESWTLRGRYGKTMPDGSMENVVHASGTPEEAEVEITRFFPRRENFLVRLWRRFLGALA